ncbi:MAG: prephenate dehydrogenase [Mycobacteriales bacterium]
MSTVLVVGCGLIGTSIALAIQDRHEVCLHDEDPAVLAQALARGAGRPWDGSERVDLLVAAVPPASIAPVLKEAQRRDLSRTYTHVASVQSQVQQEVEALGCDLSRIVGGHPLAGRELSGPAAALADLFVGRPWAVCPSPQASRDAVEAVEQLARDCGAQPVLIGPDAHDEAVALVSHLPQVVASALAGQLVPDAEEQPGIAGEGQPPSGHSPVGRADRRAERAAVAAAAPSVALAGPGLGDATRLAASDPQLWAQILRLNAAHVGPAVADLAQGLSRLAESLAILADSESGAQAQEHASDAVRAFLVRGNQGRALVPLKRGVLSEAFSRVGVKVADEPGTLAALLLAAADAGVNVEDVHVEHVPGRPRGIIELLVQSGSAGDLSTALSARGWDVV